MAHDFNPRSPCGERLLPSAAIQDGSEHFNPRSPCGERLLTGRWLLTLPVFQSTLPVWGATYALIVNHFFRDISIHAPRVGSDRQGADQTQTETISIHAPRVGSDTADESSLAIAAISIHAPRVGSDAAFAHSGRTDSQDFNPRSPCGERRVPFLLGQAEARDFNPRSPCGERRTPRLWRWITSIFQSTLPVWGATWGRCVRQPYSPISIHAPRVGSDPTEGAASAEPVNFNPRSPCGERHLDSGLFQGGFQFQSTLPVWGATQASQPRPWRHRYFNPRSPCGERPVTSTE